MVHEKNVALLQAHPLFRGVDVARLELLVFTAERMKFAEGDIIIARGAHMDGACVMTRGNAVMLANNAVGRAVVSRFDTGDLIGETALLKPVTSEAQVRAANAVEIMKLPREVFLRLAREFPELGLGLARAATQRLSMLAADLSVLGQRKNMERKQQV